MAEQDTVLQLVQIIERLERDLSISESRADRYAAMWEAEKPVWYERLWDSDVVKVGLFIGGVYLGQRMVLIR